MSEICLEILDKERRLIFNKLGRFSPLGYLSGGTALALQISHRLSLDFDFFMDKPLSRTLVKRCWEVFGDIQVVRQTADQITLLAPSNIKIDFVYYWYPLIKPLIKTPVINLASVADIAADKTETIGRRAAWRDYVDIFFLLKKKVFNLESLISYAQKKFKGEFNELLLLEQLVYFKDLEMANTAFLKESYSETEIKQFLKQEVKKHLASLGSIDQQQI